jgi:hypothetical protein
MRKDSCYGKPGYISHSFKEGMEILDEQLENMKKPE